MHPTSALAGWSCVFGFNERWRKFEWGDVVGEAPTTARDGACAPRATAWSRGRLSRLGGRIKIKRAATYITAASSTYDAFLVNNWTYNASTNPTPGLWNFYFDSSIDDMVPVPSPPPYGNYGDLTNNNGAAGQNSPVPSEKAFGNHQFLQYGSTYYDASYGVQYTGEQGFQNAAIAGFGNVAPPVGGNAAFYVSKPNGLNVGFTSSSIPNPIT